QYNRLGQLTKVIQATLIDQRITTYDYDTNTFALLSEQTVRGTITNCLSYSYNPQGQQTAYSSSSSRGGDLACEVGGVLYSFDSYGRQSSIAAFSNGETNTFHFNYLHGSAMVSSITNNLGFGISKYYEDSRNLIVGISNYFGSSSVSSFEYQNDALGRRTERLDSDENLLVKTNSFSYNNYSEIVGATMNTNLYHFDHDNIGNRVYAEFPNYEEEYEVDSLNAYTEISAYNPAFFHDKFVYDLDGNMLTNQIKYSSEVWAYTWNGENRMTSATNTADGTFVTYAYDFQGRMFSKTTNGDETTFVWNGNHIIAEMTDSLTNFYTWANGETLKASLDGETVFYCHDANKNVTDLVDDSGTHFVHYDYSPFGVQSFTLFTSPFTVSLNPFRFSNEYFDATTGQVEFWRRKYFPQLGKFASRDPIGVQGGLNEYGIGGNDLINSFDLWGLSKDKVLVVIFLSIINGAQDIDTSLALDLLGTIDDNLVWKIKKEQMPNDVEKGRQYGRWFSKPKYDDECWKRLYYIEGELNTKSQFVPQKPGTYAYGQAGTFGVTVYGGSIYMDTQMDKTLANVGASYEKLGGFALTHEVLHSVGGKHLSSNWEADWDAYGEFIMAMHVWPEWCTVPPTIHEKNIKRVRKKLGVNK
ncbi:MAG: RHS repeat-associated core domain-containing protein, partial [Kiritimatiellae bacterium]|nr:RHS repeat-associated core domain-containing protein [Kiritimatiellia bacterium]